MDGDDGILKAKAVPLRQDISLEDISGLKKEIVDQELWLIHTVLLPNGKTEIYIEDPVFEEKQPIPGQKYPSKIKMLIKNSGNTTLTKCQKTPDSSLITELNRTELNYITFQNLYNENCPNLLKSTRLSKDRIKKINARISECSDMNWWTDVFEKANLIFLPPNEGYPNGWKPDLEFMVKNGDNAIRIYEGKYDKSGPSKGFGGAKKWLEAKDRQDEKTGL